MVRLMLVLAPVMCILGGIGASSLLIKYMKDLDCGKSVDKKSKKFENNYVLRKEVRATLCFNIFKSIFVLYIQKLHLESIKIVFQVIEEKSYSIVVLNI